MNYTYLIHTSKEKGPSNKGGVVCNHDEAVGHFDWDGVNMRARLEAIHSQVIVFHRHLTMPP